MGYKVEQGFENNRSRGDGNTNNGGCVGNAQMGNPCRILTPGYSDHSDNCSPTMNSGEFYKNEENPHPKGTPPPPPPQVNGNTTIDQAIQNAETAYLHYYYNQILAAGGTPQLAASQSVEAIKKLHEIGYFTNLKSSYMQKCQVAMTPSYGDGSDSNLFQDASETTAFNTTPDAALNVGANNILFDANPRNLANSYNHTQAEASCSRGTTTANMSSPKDGSNDTTNAAAVMANLGNSLNANHNANNNYNGINNRVTSVPYGISCDATYTNSSSAANNNTYITKKGQSNHISFSLHPRSSAPPPPPPDQVFDQTNSHKVPKKRSRFQNAPEPSSDVQNWILRLYNTHSKDDLGWMQTLADFIRRIMNEIRSGQHADRDWANEPVPSVATILASPNVHLESGDKSVMSGLARVQGNPLAAPFHQGMNWEREDPVEGLKVNKLKPDGAGPKFSMRFKSKDSLRVQNEAKMTDAGLPQGTSGNMGSNYIGNNIGNNMGSNMGDNLGDKNSNMSSPNNRPAQSGTFSNSYVGNNVINNNMNNMQFNNMSSMMNTGMSGTAQLNQINTGMSNISNSNTAGMNTMSYNDMRAGSNVSHLNNMTTNMHHMANSWRGNNYVNNLTTLNSNNNDTGGGMNNMNSPRRENNCARSSPDHSSRFSGGNDKEDYMGKNGYNNRFIFANQDNQSDHTSYGNSPHGEDYIALSEHKTNKGNSRNKLKNKDSWSKNNDKDSYISLAKTKRGNKGRRAKKSTFEGELTLREQSRRQERLSRFTADESGKEGKPSFAGQPLTWEEKLELGRSTEQLVGLNTALEKRYTRLCGPPDPLTVRPEAGLRKSFLHIMKRYDEEGAKGWPFLEEQFRSIRQDLTVQRIRNSFTLQVYEANGRIALENSDLGQFNQCQTQIPELARELDIPPLETNRVEFTMYRLLYLALQNMRLDLLRQVRELSDEQKQNPHIRYAMDVRRALADGNYHRYFRLLKNAPFLGRKLMEVFNGRLRILAVVTIATACKRIPVSILSTELSFCNENECLEFLHNEKVIWVEQNRLVDSRASLPIISSSPLLKSRKVKALG